MGPEEKSSKGVGCLILIVGGILALFGVIISLTVIGAVIGIPMALVGDALFGWGFVKFFKKQDK
ncbi:MAG: hypothetical protein ABIL70_08755 [candidate division WOR-3 bacterium]